MRTFSYRGFDFSGRSAQGLVEALDAKEARERLHARGILAESLDPAGDRPAGRWSRRTGMSTDGRAQAYRELGALLRAGVPMVPALDIVIQAQTDAASVQACARLRDRLREGGHLAAALGEIQPDLPGFEMAVLQAGERSGSLGTVLDRLADHLEDSLRTRERLISALVYPAFVVGLALLVAGAMFGFILPNLQKLFAESQIPLPWLTRALLATGRGLFLWGAPLLVTGALTAFLLTRQFRASPSLRVGWQRRLLGWPLIGRTRVWLANVRFCETLALLLRGGVPVVDALELAGTATGNAWVEQGVNQAAAEVRHGRPMSAALHQAPALAGVLTGWLAAGEAAGDVAGMLDQAALRIRAQWQQHLTRVLSVIEPALIVTVGVFVLLVALAVLLPILSLNRTFV